MSLLNENVLCPEKEENEFDQLNLPNIRNVKTQCFTCVSLLQVKTETFCASFKCQLCLLVLQTTLRHGVDSHATCEAAECQISPLKLNSKQLLAKMLLCSLDTAWWSSC